MKADISTLTSLAIAQLAIHKINVLDLRQNQTYGKVICYSDGGQDYVFNFRVGQMRAFQTVELEFNDTDWIKMPGLRDIYWSLRQACVSARIAYFTQFPNWKLELVICRDGEGTEAIMELELSEQLGNMKDITRLFRPKSSISHTDLGLTLRRVSESNRMTLELVVWKGDQDLNLIGVLEQAKNPTLSAQSDPKLPGIIVLYNEQGKLWGYFVPYFPGVDMIALLISYEKSLLPPGSEKLVGISNGAEKRYLERKEHNPW